mmetsp:Transcript_106315/g.253815  ORF Transcript_106315/g.253815 Transcript_106315/m.253815 type:complete len:218 (-) Transcript_106315:1864-2517(-)
MRYMLMMPESSWPSSSKTSCTSESWAARLRVPVSSDSRSKPVRNAPPNEWGDKVRPSCGEDAGLMEFRAVRVARILLVFWTASFPVRCCSKRSFTSISRMPRFLHIWEMVHTRKTPLESAVKISGGSTTSSSALSSEGRVSCSSDTRRAQTGTAKTAGGTSVTLGSTPLMIGKFLKWKTQVHWSGCGRVRQKDTCPPWSATTSKHRLGRKSTAEMTC